MTDIRNADVTCVKCGMSNNIKIFASINSNNPELRVNLISGQIWAWNCKICKENNNTIYPILYHDMSNRFMVQYIDEKMPGRDLALTRMLPSSEQLKSMATMKGYRFRLCGTLPDFVEKVLIATTGLDDIAIEACRPDFPRPKDGPDSKRLDIEFKFTEIAEGPPKAIVFRPSPFAYQGLERALSSSVPFDVYLMAASRIKACMPAAAILGEEFITVDKSYLWKWFDKDTAQYIGPEQR